MVVFLNVTRCHDFTAEVVKIIDYEVHEMKEIFFRSLPTPQTMA
jgi:hypothetical protein